MNTTADSNLTKRALAAAMKELMEQMPFSKISVSDIAEQCGMNRKSFYYHFKDKYDLVNWIFDMEYLQLSSRQDYAGIWDFLTELCSFFYENRSFYRRALRIEGQNSFLEHFKDCLLYTSGLSLSGAPSGRPYPHFCAPTPNYRIYVCALCQFQNRKIHATIKLRTNVLYQFNLLRKGGTRQ